MARVTRGACSLLIFNHSFAPLHCRTSQYRRTFVPLSVSLWNDLGDPVFDGVGLAGFESRANAFLFEGIIIIIIIILIIIIIKFNLRFHALFNTILQQHPNELRTKSYGKLFVVAYIVYIKYVCIMYRKLL